MLSFSFSSLLVRSLYFTQARTAVMFTAAQQAGISSLRLGFTGTLKVLRRAIADFQDVQSEQLPFFSPS
jgi:hypothetical protein